MNLQSVRLNTGFSLLMKTLPLTLVRLGAVLLFWVVAIVYLALVGAVALLVSQAIEILGIIIFFVALVGVVPLYNLAYRYVFFMIKAAHIAVYSELIVNGKLPEGVNQLAYGRQRVEERFGEVNGMFVVDELVNGVVHAFTNTVYAAANFLPGETLETLARVINRVVKFAMNYIDEAIMARSFWGTEQNVWANARDGVVLYAQAWQPLLMNAVVLMLLSYVPSVVGFILLAAPVGLLLALISPTLAGWSIILALFLAYLLKVAIGDAFAIAVMISAYHRETQDMAPNPEMTERLDGLSNKFRELRDKAMQAVSPAEEAAKREDVPSGGAMSREGSITDDVSVPDISPGNRASGSVSDGDPSALRGDEAAGDRNDVVTPPADSDPSDDPRYPRG